MSGIYVSDDDAAAIEDKTTKLAANVVTHDGQNRLQVGTAITAITGTGSYSNKLRYVDMNASNGGIARGTSVTNAAFVDVFSYSGSGYLVSFSITLETGADWDIRLVVDSNEIFLSSSGIPMNDLTSDNVHDMDGSGKSINENFADMGFYIGAHDIFRWSSPRIPIKYTTSVVVKVKRSGATAAKLFRAGLVCLTKDT